METWIGYFKGVVGMEEPKLCPSSCGIVKSFITTAMDDTSVSQ